MATRQHYGFLALTAMLGTTLCLALGVTLDVYRQDQSAHQLDVNSLPAPAAGPSGLDELEGLARQNLFKPDSFERLAVNRWPAGSDFVVRLTYSAVNSRGDRTERHIEAKLNSDGKVLEVIGRW
ncbi:hypothetical protein PVT67_08625 [Gallaecimonas kandeliae]|uniref:hypothetical protein n=1 Tax=Gallaecimonas kandeliae TaxID=3029055 RepID=UPI002649C9F8|nr:hypothetical protein [Gallaecimonas kandeliae]WKE67279.1 hypothetical protein PVT67_08625 [Gallaecimonas kandeliae]